MNDINPAWISPKSVWVDAPRVLAKYGKTLNSGDLVYLFCSPNERWTHMGGVAGLVVMRDGVQAYHIVTLIN